MLCSQLTALQLGHDWADGQEPTCKGDEDMGALVRALSCIPLLRKLHFSNFPRSTTDAGLLAICTEDGAVHMVVWRHGNRAYHGVLQGIERVLQQPM